MRIAQGDVNGLKENQINAAGWDPYYAPHEKIIESDLVNLGFVINVIENIDERIEALKKAFDILKPDGRMILLTYESCFKPFFICYRFSKIFKGNLKRFFEILDNGRYNELTKLSRSSVKWEQFFVENNMYIEKMESGLSQFAWAVYDTQTRPFFRFFITLFNRLNPKLRTFIKICILFISYPFLLIFYIFLSL